MACRGLLLEEPNRAVETAGDHCLSCDNDAATEKWIRSTCSPAVYVKDLKEMEDSVVRDTITGRDVLRPRVTTASCGWVCHTAPGSK